MKSEALERFRRDVFRARDKHGIDGVVFVSALTTILASVISELPKEKRAGGLQQVQAALTIAFDLYQDEPAPKGH